MNTKYMLAFYINRNHTLNIMLSYLRDSPYSELKKEKNMHGPNTYINLKTREK